jgi:ATP-dependent DNA helicase PIF1
MNKEEIIIDTTIYDEVIEKLTNENKSFFIHGKAGTGKSTFVDYLRQQLKGKMAVVAPTGVSAINVKGQTIHSFFKFAPYFIKPEDIDKDKRPTIYQKLDYLVIDEISMVRADILDGIDIALRKNRNKTDIAFGGVKVIMVGDVYQLPPVVKKEEDVVFKHYGYNGHYFFHSKVFQEIIQNNTLKFIEFSKVFRQTDKAWIENLNKIRKYQYDNNLGKILDSKIVESPTQIPKGTIILTTTNKVADNHNQKHLAKLPGNIMEYSAEFTGDFPEKEYPTENVLKLKVGAQVLFIKNDETKNWVNGDIGIIKQMFDNYLIVNCKNQDYQVVYQTWEKIKYEFKNGKIEEVIIGKFKQLPIRLGWAITIHKSQGQTYEKVAIDNKVSAFAPGQIYVALSRCKTYEGVYLFYAINEKELIENKQLDRFWEIVESMLQPN